MRIAIIKSTAAGPNNSHYQPNPGAPIGEQPSGAINWEISDVPDDVSDGDVIRALRASIISPARKYRISFVELGAGRLIR